MGQVIGMATAGVIESAAQRKAPVISAMSFSRAYEAEPNDPERSRLRRWAAPD
jgi:hypothetical protein